MARKTSNPDPVQPNIPNASPGGLGSGIVPNLNPFGNTAPGQEGSALDNAISGLGSGSGTGNGYWDTSQNQYYPRVYWGQMEDRAGKEDFIGPIGKTADHTMTLQDSINQYSLWSPDQRRGYALKMYRAGLVTNPDNWNEVNNAWATIVQDAGLRYAMSSGKDKVTPYDMLDLMVGVGQRMGAGGKATAKTTTTHHMSFNANVIDGDTADSMVRAIFHDQVGRDPTANELNTYRVMVTGYSKAHPSKTDTTTTTTTDGTQQTGSDGSVVSDGNTTSTTKSTNSGGWTSEGANNVIRNKVEGDPEYGAYQSATTYYNALQELIANGH